MDLEDVIEYLQDLPADRVVRHGLCNPHSYRGWYEQVAFELKDNVSVGAMLASVRSALGATYTGYKGGSYMMRESTLVNIANEGETGGELSQGWLEYLCSDVVETTKVLNAQEKLVDLAAKMIQLRTTEDVAATARRLFLNEIERLYDGMAALVVDGVEGKTFHVQLRIFSDVNDNVVSAQRYLEYGYAARGKVSGNE